MDFVIAHEVGNAPNGGYTNIPADPGGETKWGVSKRAHPGLDIKNLTKEKAESIYEEEYWKRSRADKLPYPLSLVHFDTAVNSGINTANIIRAASKDSILDYLLLRILFYLRLVKKRKRSAIFLRGWVTRVLDLYQEVVRCPK